LTNQTSVVLFRLRGLDEYRITTVCIAADHLVAFGLWPLLVIGFHTEITSATSATTKPSWKDAS